ncbi:5'-methylthioadenosine/S-adenosylhomocysteine nucleosidase family protein [Catenuloplanes atrovinosus]|uniref:Nucleoside phosphorylase n=1 Tax=Catenuloplanes atrovinosus TaxID=137266 RepID=A0AAE4CB68_9ACTN|nr:hypothetical protein [Catenuloplanes atrovinosus]MDR7277783.1 nucleoside phosphorylase [Catenuloplanes atrovinosus]
MSQTFNVNTVNSDNVQIGNHSVMYARHLDATPVREDGPTIALATALPEEFAAMYGLLDRPSGPFPVQDDHAIYVRGSLPGPHPNSSHDVVLTLLKDTGNGASAESTANLARSFPSVVLVCMVGVAAGVPAPTKPDRHVRLGDIVAATWGIEDYDHVVQTDDGARPRQPFPRPSPLLVSAAQYLAAMEIRGERPWLDLIDRALTALPAHARPDGTTDRIYAADSDRVIPHPPMSRSGHLPGRPKVHRGLIGSADRALRSAAFRDAVAAKTGMIAFEMEGKGLGSAGFANGLQWFVVRGISDYGDARTTLRWRGYASTAAAAYTRALLGHCAPLLPRGGRPQAAGARA